MLGPDSFYAGDTLEGVTSTNWTHARSPAHLTCEVAAAATEEGHVFRCLQDCAGHPSSPEEEEDCPRKPQAHHHEGAQLHQIRIGNPRDRETEKGKDKNVEATATALAAALTNAITGVVTHSMIDMEAAEQRGSIAGQEILFSYINHVGYNKIG
ncbi:uncharacterized protein CLUP02_16660 [Colletotrichum lupini]|uniref:Uncharacterized protein n=1 Tax=Colletotrichum lupini TaxID=145971 RepID=A0A9Q8T8B6_9PEZI|nr:uncharacterized protein CLUP02_16660 [Colletotrichum lupini]UQC91126.1 hypothetical protein CLUP02_16660 [Colletotrichum lupini]